MVNTDAPIAIIVSPDTAIPRGRRMDWIMLSMGGMSMMMSMMGDVSSMRVPNRIRSAPIAMKCFLKILFAKVCPPGVRRACSLRGFGGRPG